MSALVKQLRLLQAWYLPAGPEPEEAMPSKYRAFKEAADRIVELERDLAAAKENLQSADEDRLRMRAQTARLDAALIEKDISIAAHDAELAEVMKWKEAVINELIVAHIYSQAHDDSPRKAIQDAITWNCQVALDPAVSSDAQRLRDTHLQRAEAAERDAFTMAAGQCIVKSGGLMGDDHGHQYCDMERQRDEWKRKAEEAARDSARLDWMIEHGTDEGGGSGFEFRVYIPHDSECLRDAIDADIAAKGGA